MKFQVVIATAVLGVTSLLASVAYAAVKTVTLDVPGMTCAACPITVKKALTKVSGVTDAKVSYEAKQAVVKYDDAKTSADALMKATANAGYPSTIKARK